MLAVRRIISDPFILYRGFDTINSVGGIAAQLLAGGIGMMLPYRTGTLLLGGISLCGMLFLIVLPHRANRPVYEAVRQETTEEGLSA